MTNKINNIINYMSLPLVQSKVLGGGIISSN